MIAENFYFYVIRPIVSKGHLKINKNLFEFSFADSRFHLVVTNTTITTMNRDYLRGKIAVNGHQVVLKLATTTNVSRGVMFTI